MALKHQYDLKDSLIPLFLFCFLKIYSTNFKDCVMPATYIHPPPTVQYITTYTLEHCLYYYNPHDEFYVSILHWYLIFIIGELLPTCPTTPHGIQRELLVWACIYKRD